MSRRDLEGPGRYRRNATGETSREAAAGSKKTLRQRVLERLERGPASPEMIFGELEAEGVRTVLTSVRPRCTDLQKLGLVRDSGQRGRSEGGKRSIIWERCSPEQEAAYLAAKDTAEVSP